MPIPPRMNAGRSVMYPDVSVIRDSRNREAATSDMPVASSQREPYLSDALPAIGAATMIRIVIGKNRTPVSIGERPIDRCM